MTRLIAVLMGMTATGCAAKTPPNTTEPTEAPTVAAIVEHAIEATGGRARLEAIENARISYSVSIPQQGIEGTLLVHHSAPNQMMAQQEFPGLAVVNQGYDGTHGWATDNLMGPRLLGGVELETTRRDAHLYWLMDFDTYYPEATVAERTDFAGEPAWKVQAQSAWDREDEFFFHTKTGLQLGAITLTETPMGSMPMEIRFENYEDRDGLVLATRQVVVTGPVEMITELVEFEINAESFPTIEVPEDVQALLEASP
ncbi:MAG: hypothetical protein VX519_05330 [Myxococcota bacterium]|nr:hypothetical protein [Myxococcota bacterium]